MGKNGAFYGQSYNLQRWSVIDTGFGARCNMQDCERPWYIEGLCKLHHDMKLYREERNAPTHG